MREIQWEIMPKTLISHAYEMRREAFCFWQHIIKGDFQLEIKTLDAVPIDTDFVS